MVLTTPRSAIQRAETLRSVQGFPSTLPHNLNVPTLPPLPSLQLQSALTHVVVYAQLISPSQLHDSDGHLSHSTQHTTAYKLVMTL